LCLFFVLVGLEIDAGVIKRNARLHATIALAGMILLFGIGVGMAHAVYKEFINPEIVFTDFCCLPASRTRLLPSLFSAAF
jgi:Kef-type K+ transport system membrane component KefB